MPERRRPGEGGCPPLDRDLVLNSQVKEFGFQWHLTDLCNQRCTHCYQSKFNSDGELDFESQKQLVRNIFGTLENCRISVNLTGGEPFLLPWLGDLVEYLHGFSNLDEIYIITNGTLKCSEQIHQLLKEKKVSGIKISLESGDQVVNDRVRGKENFSRISANIEGFIRRGYRVIPMMTLARYNLHTIEKTIEWARVKHVPEIIFEQFVPIGIGADLVDQVLTPDDWLIAFDAIIRAGEIDAEPSDLEPFHAFWLDLSDNTIRGAACNLGDESMALMPDGTVYPCRRLPVPVGNVLKEPFEEILKRLAGYAPSSGCKALVRAVMGGMSPMSPIKRPN